ncbi:MAG: NAD-dependent epimerase/dehydratase family protein [Polaribacter sp.]
MHPKQTVLITGASGLLAINTITQLLNNNYKVIGLLRNKNKFPLKQNDNLQLVIGDITKPDSYEKYVKMSDIIIHIAAITDQNIIAYETYKKVNVIATKMVLDIAIQQQLKTFIYVSTANSFGFGGLSNLGDENKPIKTPFDKSLYAKSKLEGQKLVLESAKKQNTTKIIVTNPTFMIGGFDTKPSSGRIILSAYKKRILFYPPGGKSFINVKDAAKGLVNSIELGKHGEAYILSGHNLSYLEFYKKVTKQLNQKSTFVKIPKTVLLGIGYVGNLLRFLGIKSDISLTNVKTLCVANFYSNKKAVSQIKLKQNPIEEGIIDAIDWFKLK